MYGYRHCNGAGYIESVQNPRRISLICCGRICSSASALPYAANYFYISFINTPEPTAKPGSYLRKPLYRKKYILACRQCQAFRQIGFSSQSTAFNYGITIYSWLFALPFIVNIENSVSHTEPNS